MNSDLIERKEVIFVLKEVFKKYNIGFKNGQGGFADEVPRAIEAIPIVYDVGKVVERTERHYKESETQEKMTLTEAIEHLDDILQSDKKWECEECKNEHIKLRDWLNELKSYKDLEEQGKLWKLPCAVGDRIYRIDTDENIKDMEIEIYDIDNIVILSDGTILLKYAYDGVICHLENIVTDKPYLDFYRCFLTKEEAKAALKEL